MVKNDLLAKIRKKRCFDTKRMNVWTSNEKLSLRKVLKKV